MGMNGILCHSRGSGNPDTFISHQILDARLRGHDGQVQHLGIVWKEAPSFKAGNFTSAGKDAGNN
jgi:hypothetical protein